MSDEFFNSIYKEHSRKCKVLRIPQHAILNLLCSPAEMNAIYKIDLPEDVKVIRTWVDHEYRAIGFLLESESFEEVKEGSLAPELDWLKMVVRIYETENLKNDLH